MASQLKASVRHHVSHRRHLNRNVLMCGLEGVGAWKLLLGCCNCSRNAAELLGNADLDLQLMRLPRPAFCMTGPYQEQIFL